MTIDEFFKDRIDIDVYKLKDVEERILNYMFSSESNFRKIKNTLNENDFTFSVHRLIFKDLHDYEEILMFDEIEDIRMEVDGLRLFSLQVQVYEYISIQTVLNVLSQPPSTDVEKDLEYLNMNSMEKEIAINKKGVETTAIIENMYGTTTLKYTDYKLINVITTNIAKLPIEIRDNFIYTIMAINAVSDDEDFEIFSGLDENKKYLKNIYFKKDISYNKWLDEICLWSEKYDMDEEIFPRSRCKLQKMYMH